MDTSVWTKKDLLAALKVKGYNLATLAVEMGITYPAARYALRTGASAAFRDKLCGLLQTDPWVIWPDLYPPQWRKSGPPPK
jgi:lambda repressor-like predicted transcriptional regulator